MKKSNSKIVKTALDNAYEYGRVSNGPGVRAALFVAGCRIHCPFCFNGDAWDFCAGKPFDEKTQDGIIELMNRVYCEGLTVLGGEPMEPENQLGLVSFLEKVKSELREDQQIWMYSGYVFDKDIYPEDGARHTDVTGRILDCVDVMVDSPFINELRDENLRFRGSSNQRIIDVQKTLRNGAIVEWKEPVSQFVPVEMSFNQVE